MGNFVDEPVINGLDMFYECEITHTVRKKDEFDIDVDVDEAYKDLGPSFFKVQVMDDDEADVFMWTISPDEYEYETSTVNYDESYNSKFLSFFSEENGTVAYSIRLESEPTDDVTVQTTVTLLNTTRLLTRLLEPPIVATIPGALTFTSGNWNTRQRVLVRSMGDNVDHDMERFRIDHAITTTDAVFSGKLTQTLVVVIDVADDNEAEVVLAENSGLTLKAGTTDYIRILRLMSRPVHDVTLQVNITSPDVTATPSTIIVPKDDWRNVSRSIKLSIVSDNPTGGNPDIKIHTVTLDKKYSALPPIDFIATVATDEDKPTTNITSGPAKFSREKSDWDFVVRSADDVVRFEWSLNGEPYEPLVCGSNTACPLRIVKFLKKGQHLVEIRGVSNIGVVGDAVRHEFEVSHCNDAKEGMVDQYAKIERDGGLECIDCPHPVGANCKKIDATWEEVYANVGWWTKGTRADTYYRCPYKTSCIGGRVDTENGTVKSRCEQGYEGPVCAVCAPGYFLSDEMCAVCPETQGGSTALVALVFGGVFLGFLLMLLQQMRVKTSDYYWGALKQSGLKKKKSGLDRKTMKKIRIFARFAKTTAKTFITYLQILSVSDSAFNIPWPKGFLTFLRYLNPVNLDFFSISGLGCVVEYKFYDSHLFMVLLPVFIMLFIYLAYVLGLWRHRGYYKGRFTTGMQTAYANQIIQFTMWMTIIVYPSLSRRTIQYFTCSVKIDDTQYLMEDYRLQCFRGQWLTNLPWGIIGVALYPLGIPAYVGVALWRRRHRLEETAVVHRYGFLYEMYRRENYWWDVYEMLQKLFLTGVIVLIFPGKTLQVVLVVLADLGFLMNLLIQKPHQKGPTRNLAMMANMAMTLTMYCGLVLVTVDGTEKYSLLFDLVLIIMNGAVAVYAAVHIFPCKVCCIYYKGRIEFKKNLKEQEKIKRRRSIGLSESDKSDFVLKALSSSSPFGATKQNKSRRTTSVVPNMASKQVAPRRRGSVPVNSKLEEDDEEFM